MSEKKDIFQGDLVTKDNGLLTEDEIKEWNEEIETSHETESTN